MAQNFDYKPGLSPDAILAAHQRKSQAEAALEQQQQTDESNSIIEAAKATSQMVSGMVSQSKAKQKREFVKNLAELALHTRPSNAPTGPLTEQQDLQNKSLSAAIMANPDEATKQFLEKAYNTSASGAGMGTFGGAIPVVNSKTGERGFLQADKAGNYKLSDGRPFTPEWQREYAPAVMADPGTLQPTLYPKTPGLPATPIANPNSGANAPELPFAKRPLKEKTEIRQQIADLRGDEVFQTAERTLNTIGNIKNVLNQDLTVATGAIRSLASRVIAGEKGVLTDRDVERQLGTDVANRFKRLIRGAADGKLTDQDYRELQTIIQSSLDRATEQYTSTQGQMIETLGTQYGINEREAKILLRYRDPSAVVANQGKKPVKAVDRPVGITEPTAGQWDDSKEKRYQELLKKKQQGTLK